MGKLIRRDFEGQADYLAMRKMLIQGYLAVRKPCNMFSITSITGGMRMGTSQRASSESAVCCGLMGQT